MAFEELNQEVDSVLPANPAASSNARDQSYSVDCDSITAARSEAPGRAPTCRSLTGLRRLSPPFF